MESTIHYFEKRKPENTDVLLALVKQKTQATGITHVVVASTRGDTGIKAANVFKDTDVKVIVVTHQTGYRGSGTQLLTEAKRKTLEDLEVTVVTCTDAFGGDAGVGERQLSLGGIELGLQGLGLGLGLVASLSQGSWVRWFLSGRFGF